MTRLLRLSIFTSALLYAAISFGDVSERKFVLRFNGQQFRQQSKLFLKQELKRQLGIRPQNFRLVRVRLVAKSKNGNGRAKLVVGQDQTQMKYVNGAPRDFRFNDVNTWDRINFRNPSYNSRGSWQIHMRGNIKVKKIVVFLERKRGSRPGRGYGPGNRPGRGNRPGPGYGPGPGFGKACFFMDAFYGARSFCLNSGRQVMNLNQFRNGLFNDDISSLKVFGGASVKVCTERNLGGRCKTFYNNQSQLGFTGDFWSIALNNKISSIEIF